VNEFTPAYRDESVTVYEGECLDVLRGMPDCSVDSVVTDPPYSYAFMGKNWDSHESPRAFQAWCESWARECLRVLKPGGFLAAFGGTRTFHRLACGVEDAGFEVRDSIGYGSSLLAWTYGSGFPKSLNVATAVDKLRDGRSTELSSDESRFCAWMRDHSGLTAADARRLFTSDRFLTGTVQILNTATAASPRIGRRAMVPTAAAWAAALPEMNTPPEWVNALVKNPPQPPGGTPGDEWHPGAGVGTAGSNEWAGFGTALRPSWEPIVVARKPIRGTVASNVVTWGTGALNIDGCRVAGERVRTTRTTALGVMNDDGWVPTPAVFESHPAGRWPPNVVLDESAAAELDRQSGTGPSHGLTWGGTNPNPMSWGSDRADAETTAGYTDSGGASRFFPVFKYEPKAPTAERPKLPDGTAHPTVKPRDLCAWLARLFTPPGGLILDPFAGTGTTGEAAVMEGFRAVLIERDPKSVEMIRVRLRRPIQAAMFGA